MLIYIHYYTTLTIITQKIICLSLLFYAPVLSIIY